MYEVPNYTTYYVYCWEGKKCGPYKGLEHFAHYWHNSIMKFDVKFDYVYWDDWKEFPEINVSRYSIRILKNDLGDIIDPDVVYKACKEYRNKTRKSRQYWNWHPGSKRSNCSFHRKIKTLHSKKWANAHDDYELNFKCNRGKRSKSSIPDSSWDDFVRSDYRNNNWKRYRKTQYKVK